MNIQKLRVSMKYCAGLAVLLALHTPATVQAVTTPEDTLLVWAGDALHQAPDFVSVVDFNKNSRTYGKVLRVVPLPAGNTTTPLLPTASSAPWASATDKNGNFYGGAIGNEPHHTGVSADKKTFVGSGLLSALNGQNQVFFFDITRPRYPKFSLAEGAQNNGNPNFAGSLTYASIADEFKGLNNNHFLATFMGSFSGNSPGRLLEYDEHHKLVGVWPALNDNDPAIPSAFNPHGLSFDESRNVLVTSDFICPIHTIFGHEHDGGNSDVFRGSVRYWNFNTRKITKTIPVGDGKAGTIDVNLIPNDGKNRSYTAGVIDGKLYLVDPTANSGQGTATVVFDFNTHPSFIEADGTPPWPHLIRINRGGTRLFITVNYQGKHGRVAQFNISNRTAPKLLSVVDLGPNSGPHYLRLTQDEQRLLVSDYFVDENLGVNASDIGHVRIEGDHKVHVLNVTGNSIKLDTNFKLDFTKDIKNIPGYGGTYPVNSRPHSFVLVGGS
jgi:selenium-binding protein 1